MGKRYRTPIAGEVVDSAGAYVGLFEEGAAGDGGSPAIPAGRNGKPGVARRSAAGHAPQPPLR